MILRKIKYFGAVTANSLWQFRMRNIFSITIICLSFLIVGIFLSLSNNLRHIARQFSSNMIITFFLDKDTDAAEARTIERRIQSSPLVSRVDYIGSEQALERFQKKFPELKDILANLKNNPFPAALEARLTDAAPLSSEISIFVEDIRKIKGVEDAQFNQEWVEKINSLSRLAKAVGFFLGGILVLASFFIISNIIKLNVFARKGEIEILRLVGGTNVFIRIPFIMEGMILGILGSLLSLAFLFLAIKTFPLYIGSLGALQKLLSFRYLSLSQSLELIAAGATIGLLGSATSVSRFLKN